jgi:hypothetical protein
LVSSGIVDPHAAGVLGVTAYIFVLLQMSQT